MKLTLDGGALDDVIVALDAADREARARYPGPRDDRQPVHAVYGGADRFAADLVEKFGRIALEYLDRFAPDGATLSRAVGLADVTADGKPLAESVRDRVRSKLETEPVEDYRIDFEDGYGFRSDDEEDRDAERAAAALASMEHPPFSVGIRIEPLSPEHRARAIRTLDGFLTALAAQSYEPGAFVVTLPKITTPAEPAALATLLDRLEARLGWPMGTVEIELLIETPQLVVGPDGRSGIPAVIEACEGRCRSVHLGAYDYTASLDVTAPHQSMLHPACDHMRLMMMNAAGARGVWVVDGATNEMPIPPHRGPDPTAAERAENERVVHAAWRTHYRHVRHAIRFGIHQGWDLHPGQLVARYAAIYADVLEGLDDAAERLKNFVGESAKATRVGEKFDDAATGYGLLNYFRRAIACGALSPDEVTARTGVSPDELRGRSFAAIVAARATGEA